MRSIALAAVLTTVVLATNTANAYEPRFTNCRFDGTQKYDPEDDSCYEKGGYEDSFKLILIGAVIGFGIFHFTRDK